jgi:hypothetical protein
MSHITFFRGRQKSEGESCTFELPDPKRSTRLYIFSRKPLDSKLTENQGDDIDKAIEATAQVVQENGGGIVIALRDGERKMKVILRPPDQEASFEKVGVLRPGYQLAFESVNGKWQELPRGSQVLVPVDQKAEQMLRDFKEHVEWLPEDIGSMVWLALTRPSMDARLEKLETRVFGSPAIEKKKAGFVEQLSEWFRKPALRWSMIGVVLAALLGLGVYSLYDYLTGKEQAVEAVDSQAQAAAESISALLHAMSPERNPPPTSAVRSIYKVHFSDFETMNVDELRGILEKPSKDRYRLMHGLIKLGLLELDPNATDKTFVSGRSDLSETKKTFERIRAAKLETREARNLLATLVCRIGDFKVPILPETEAEDATLSRALVVAEGECAKFPLQTALPGLAGLKNFIEEDAAAAVSSETLTSDTP